MLVRRSVKVRIIEVALYMHLSVTVLTETFCSISVSESVERVMSFVARVLTSVSFETLPQI